MNLFTSPDYVFNSFRRVQLSADTGSSRGAIRGLSRWTSDLSLAKRTRMTEKVNIRFSADIFNFLNHPLFTDPTLSLDNPANFGVITGQQGDSSNGDYWAPRRFQLVLRIEF